MAEVVFIVNQKAPEEAITNLSKYGSVIPFLTEGLTYGQISNHPDVFLCAGTHSLVAAPNTPAPIVQKIKSYGFEVITGEKPVGTVYPDSALYNAVVTDNYLIHNLSITDSVVLKTYRHLKPVAISQGYGRCNLLPLKNNCFITSDRGILKTLIKQNIDVLYVDSSRVVLPGFKHGFFGGCAGVYGDTVFLLGSLDYFTEGNKVKDYLHRLNYRIVELYRGPLFDGGSIVCIA